MGNYYEGNLSFRFNKDIKPSLLNDLNLLLTKSYDDTNKSCFTDELQNTPWLKCSYSFYPGFTLYELYDVDGSFTHFELKTEDDNFDPNDEWDQFEREQREDYYKELKQHPFVGYELEVSFCMKHYLAELDLGKAMVEYFKPYLDINLYDDGNGGYIGNISDEDGTYYEDFYIDNECHPITEARLPICSGCCLEYKSATCENYGFCSRAYNLGKESAHCVC